MPSPRPLGSPATLIPAPGDDTISQVCLTAAPPRAARSLAIPTHQAMDSAPLPTSAAPPMARTQPTSNTPRGPPPKASKEAAWDDPEDTSISYRVARSFALWLVSAGSPQVAVRGSGLLLSSAMELRVDAPHGYGGCRSAAARFPELPARPHGQGLSAG